MATVTVKQVYGKVLADLRAPEGWEFTWEFRAPGNGEYWMNTVQAWGEGQACFPFLILRKRQARRIVFEEDAAGGWVEANNGIMQRAEGSEIRRTRYRRREEPQPPG